MNPSKNLINLTIKGRRWWWWWWWLLRYWKLFSGSCIKDLRKNLDHLWGKVLDRQVLVSFKDRFYGILVRSKKKTLIISKEKSWRVLRKQSWKFIKKKSWWISGIALIVSQERSWIVLRKRSCIFFRKSSLEKPCKGFTISFTPVGSCQWGKPCIGLKKDSEKFLGGNPGQISGKAPIISGFKKFLG